MSFLNQKQWKPSNTMLAAYADGEFEGRDDLVVLKKDIEAFLVDNPNVAKDLAKLRELRKLWIDTTPPRPSSPNWDAMFARIDRRRVARRAKANRRVLWWTVGAAAACIAIAVFAVTWFGNNQSNERFPIADEQLPPAKVNIAVKPVQRAVPTKNGVIQNPLELETLDVASMEEVEILSVDGKDIHTIVVGQLPLVGTLELAAPGEVTDVRIPNDANDIVVTEPNQRPMIWARVD